MLAGVLIGFLPLLLVLAALFALYQVAEPTSNALLDRYTLRALSFTVVQAILSALLSVALAIPLARAFARRTFPGRALLLSLFGAPFILPVIVAILGLLAVWGQTGWVNQLLGADKASGFSIYGLHGVLLAHVFFNLPLATRILLQGWQAIPAESWRLAAQLGMPPSALFFQIEWPMLRERVPGALALIFLLCITSFAVVLALGGGPKATTIELAIYESLRFDFDLTRVAGLALIQVCLCTGFAIVMKIWIREPDLGAGFEAVPFRPDRASMAGKVFDIGIIGLAVMFLGLPMLAALLEGLPPLFSGALASSVWTALLRSLAIALAAMCIGFVIAVPLLRMGLSLPSSRLWIIDVPGFVILVAPPIALGAGLFVLLHSHVAVDAMALSLTALINGLQAVPFIVGLLLPALRKLAVDYGLLVLSLGMTGWRARVRVLWPLVRKPAGTAMGLTAALSVGDLGVIALFGTPEAPTLPLYLYQQMGAYRMDAAYGAGILLLITALGLFVLFDRGVGGHDPS